LLISAMTGEMNAPAQSLGPAKAMSACRDVARRVSLELSRREGIVVRCAVLGETRQEFRPDELETAWLEEATAAVEAGREPMPLYELVRTESTCELRHLRPLWCSVPPAPPQDIELEHTPQPDAPEDRGTLLGAISVRVLVREPCMP
jgi:hypothetical protein